MAKKKVENIIINDEELIPTTLGEYKEKTTNPVFLFVVITLFVLIAFFLPNIQTYINKFFGNSSSTNPSAPVDNDKDKIDPDVDVNVERFEINSTEEMKNNLVSFNDVKLDNNILTMKIVNISSTQLNLNNYYVEIYSSENTFLQRIRIGNKELSPNGSINISSTVKDGAHKFSFVMKTENEFPDVKLTYDENARASLRCTNLNHDYEYIFVNDQLSDVIYTYKETNDSANYLSNLSTYQKLVDSNRAVNGVTPSILIDDGNTYFRYVYKVDLTIVNPTDITDENIYSVKTAPKVVKFNTEANGFTCK